MVRAKTNIALEVINIPKPCPADWEAMSGDDRVRFCGHCSLHVYNLSAMTRREAEQLVGASEGRTCVRFYRRADGTVITRDCGGAMMLAAKRVGRWARAGAALALSAVLAPIGWTRMAGAAATEERVTPTVSEHVPQPAAAALVAGQMAIMGDFAGQLPAVVEVKGEMELPPQPVPQPAPEVLGRIGPVQPPVPLMGAPLPLPPAPPATQPAPAVPSTRPAPNGG